MSYNQRQTLACIIFNNSKKNITMKFEHYSTENLNFVEKKISHY